MSETRSSWHPIAVVGAAMIVLTLVFAALWWHTINTLPDVKIPIPKMPLPNACDYYTAAGNALMDEELISSYADVIRGLKIQGQQKPSPAEISDLVRRNAPALRKLRQGFAFNYDMRALRSINDEFPEFPKYQCLARLLVIEGENKTNDGDSSGAMESYLDAMRLGVDMTRKSNQVERLMALGVP